jgi:hypothetical protein
MTHVETVRSIIERLGGTWKSDREQLLAGGGELFRHPG